MDKRDEVLGESYVSHGHGDAAPLDCVVCFGDVVENGVEWAFAGSVWCVEGLFVALFDYGDGVMYVSAWEECILCMVKHVVLYEDGA